MTAHKSKPVITPIWIAWFREYHDMHAAWGMFHVCLDDGNWEYGAAWYPDETDDEKEARLFFDSLTPSQRRRLARKCG